MSDKCFIPGGHGHADGQDLAYPLQTSATEENPTNTRAVNSDELLRLCVSNHQQIFIAYPQHVTETLKLNPGKSRTNTDIPDICFRETIPLGTRSVREHTNLQVPLDFQKQVRKTRNCIFSQDQSFTTSCVGLLWGGRSLSERGPVTCTRKLCRCLGGEDIFPAQQRGTAHGTAMKLQTGLLSRTQLRIPLHSGLNIPWSNCSFILHDRMPNYTSLSLVFRMGYSDSQMI